MCLGIPMKVVEVDGFNARCEAKGIEREVSLFMLQDEPVEPGTPPSDAHTLHEPNTPTQPY